MSKTKKRKTSKKRFTQKRASLRNNIFMTLTLVPVVIGIILIGAWALEIEVLKNQSEVTVGVLFFLLGFTASNALQKRYKLAAGWGALAVADLILLTWLSVWAQGVALVVGLAGLVYLGIEFYRQYQQDKEKEGKKT